MIIPDHTEIIKENEFANSTDLLSVEMPDSVSVIEDGAFRGCNNLETVKLPEKLKTIGAGAFSGCCSLKSIILPEGLESIGEWAFEDCTGLKTVIIPDSVTEIANGVFNGCSGLTYVIIPNSVTKIGSHAFSECTKLTNVVIPGSVTEINSTAFQGCISLSDIHVVKSNKKYDSRSNCNAIIEKETNKLILGCAKTTIPKSVTSIDSVAFSNCSELKKIVIPKSVSEIGYSAFEGCTGLNSIIVSKGNKVFDSRNNCNAIIETERNTLIQGCATTVIPNTVTAIEGRAFNGRSGLKSIVIPDSVTDIGIDAFTYCPDLTSIVVSKGNKVYDSRNNCNAIIETETNALIQGCATTVIPDSVTRIEDSAFEGCTSLTSIVIPESVKEVGMLAFCMTGLTSLVIPKSVRFFADGALCECESLTNIYVLGSTSFGCDNFIGWSSLKNIYATADWIDNYLKERIPELEDCIKELPPEFVR